MTLRPPCTLKRQDCLLGEDLSNHFMGSPALLNTPTDNPSLPCAANDSKTQPPPEALYAPGASCLEHVITTSPPILEALLLQLPTSSIFDLYHTSRALRRFLKSYPLAWKNLSFRLLPAPPPTNNASGFDSPTESSGSKRPHALDFLLRFGLPSNVTLTRLDLDNTSVSGIELHTNILDPYRAILKHLSVRGCKDVSIKYHILPFLTTNLTVPADLVGTPLALKSLYVYRCRHHRRRPYLPSSLSRRDSDSHPTHTLIEICHRFGIWTDTAWCPTPGGRCFRRKDYWIGRSGFGASEVWVPFDRLWRSQNFVGSTDNVPEARGRYVYNSRNGTNGSVGRLWDDHECGYGGEALGAGDDSLKDGKELPTHLRTSHKAFVDGFTCYACGDSILERCEQCSVRMHCVGCRKTLCHSCAFDRPMRKKRRRNIEAAADMTASVSSLDQSSGEPGINRRRKQHRRQDRFWWAPGATRSPNIMNENSQTDDSSSEEEEEAPQPDRTDTSPRLDMHWCCLKPSFSGGGGIGFIGTPNGDNVRAAPLPQGRGFEDTAFTGPPHSTPSESTLRVARSSANAAGSGDNALFTSLAQPQPPTYSLSRPHASPRSLCTSCYTSKNWRVSCKACSTPICIDHDIRQLKARRCGFRKLDRERDVFQRIRAHERDDIAVPRALRDAGLRSFLAKWRPVIAGMEATDQARRSANKWAPSDRTLDIMEAEEEEAPPPGGLNPDDPVVSTTQIRRTKSLPSLPSQMVSSSDLDMEVPAPTSPRSSNPRWTGCGAFLCPYPRALGDPRPRCTATEANLSSASSNPAQQQQQAHQNANIQLTNAHPAIPVTANLGPFGTVTITPGGNASFVYNANNPGQPLTLVPNPNAANIIQANGGNPGMHLGPQAMAPQARPPAPNTAQSSEHEALRCAQCGILVCADCRRENPVCPCSACSPVQPNNTYAQAATQGANNASGANGATMVSSNTAPDAGVAPNAPATATNATSWTTDASTSTDASHESLIYTANQLCPSCRLSPSVARRCRFTLETARALESLPAIAESVTNPARFGTGVTSLVDMSNRGDDEGLGLNGIGIVEEGSWGEFWMGVDVSMDTESLDPDESLATDMASLMHEEDTMGMEG